MMTLPGASVIEWTFTCRRDSATAKGGLVATNTTHLPRGPELVTLRSMLKPLLFGLLWRAKRSRVKGIAIVLVQEIRNTVQVPRLEYLKPFVDEFDLWGGWVRHWDGAIKGGLPGDSEATQTPGCQVYILHSCRHVTGH